LVKGSLAKAYALIILMLGVPIMVAELGAWHSSDVLQFGAFLVLAVLAAGFRVAWRTPQGSLPVAFFFVILGILQFTRSESILMAACAGLALTLPHAPSGRRIFAALFGASAMVTAATMAHFALRSQFLTNPSFNEVLRLLVASVFFFVGQTFPYAAMESLQRKLSVPVQWAHSYFWMVPYYVVGAGVAGAFAFTTARLGPVGWKFTIIAFPVAYLVIRSYNLYLARMEDSREHALEKASLHLKTIEALALAIDAKDQTTHDHLQRVQTYAVELGRDLGLSLDEMEALRAASVLHDIGKLAVPEHIISKPGKLTPEEFEKMKIHPVVGAQILERVEFPYPVVPIVRSHHERWDGSGYPDGLKGEDIPIGARILAAVDVLDALASDRQYRKALPLDKAMQVVIKDSGKSFDPKVVEVLARRYVELERKAQGKKIEPLKLATDLKVERGEAPAAGFEASASTGKANFLETIAAARQEGQALYELAQNLGSSLSVDETLSVFAVRLQHLVPFDTLAVWLRKGDKLQPAYVHGENFRLFASLEIPVGEGLSGWVVENCRPIVNGNPTVEPGYGRNGGGGLQSALAVPLTGAHSTFGSLALYHRNKDAFTRDHLRILEAITGKLALTLENALKYQNAETAAGSDADTGLPNARSLFLHLDAELARCRRQGEPCGVIVCRVEDFHDTLQSSGADAASRLLSGVARAIQGHCREYDYLATLSGGEFVVVLPGLRFTDIESRAARLAREVRQAAGTLLVTGTAHCPEQGTNAEELLAEADRRMHRARMDPRGNGSALAEVKPISTTIQ